MIKVDYLYRQSFCFISIDILKLHIRLQRFFKSALQAGYLCTSVAT